MLHTGPTCSPPGKQARLDALFANDEHTAVEVTWWIYQKMVAAYRHRDRAQGKTLMHKLITSTACGVPPELNEVTTLGRTLHTRATDVLAYLNHPRTSNGPTQTVNGHLEHPRPTALGFHNLTNDITRALLEAGGFRHHLHPRLGRALLRVLPRTSHRYSKSHRPAPSTLVSDKLSAQSLYPSAGTLQTDSRRERDILRGVHINGVRYHTFECMTIDLNRYSDSTIGGCIFSSVINKLVDHPQHLLLHTRSEDSLTLK